MMYTQNFQLIVVKNPLVRDLCKTQINQTLRYINLNLMYLILLFNNLIYQVIYRNSIYYLNYNYNLKIFY